MNPLKRFGKSRFGQGLAAALAATYIRLVYASVRWRRDCADGAKPYVEDGRPFIACFWHGRLATMRAAWTHDPKNFHMLISGHRDGVIIAMAMKFMGFGTVAGSSRRGGAQAVRSLIDMLQEGHCVGLTPDGPKGPRMRAKGGAIKSAQFTGVPIIPIGGSVRRARFLGTWDRFCLARPFTRGEIIYGEPIHVPTEARGQEAEKLRLLLEDQLNALTAEADRRCGHPAIEPAPPPGSRGGEAQEESGRRVSHAGA